MENSSWLFGEESLGAFGAEKQRSRSLKKVGSAKVIFFEVAPSKSLPRSSSKLLEAFISIVSFFFLMWYSRLGNHANTPADKSKLELSS